MSSEEDILTAADEQLLAHLDAQIEAAEGPEEYEQLIRDLRERFARYRAEFKQFKYDVEQRLERLEADATPPEADDTVLDRYARLSEAERETHLGTSEQLALTLHDEWHDIAWRLGDGAHRKIGVDTNTEANAKHAPSRLKHRLKQQLGRTPRWNEIYRALKRLALLSGGEERVDAPTGRVHISGGDYEYRERRTADNQDTKRVLWRATE